MTIFALLKIRKWTPHFNLMTTKDYDYLIVGAGLFGSTFAHQAHQVGKRCLVIDKRPHTGGNVYCENIDGINVHAYGAHIFHTDNEKAWAFVNRFVRFNHYVNSPLAYYQGKVYNMPFNMNTFSKLWGVVTPQEAKDKVADEQKQYSHISSPRNLEEQALTLCGKEFYETFIKGYTEKQWGCKATDLPTFIIKRIPFRFTYNNNYFDDLFQGIPIGGYNLLIEALLKNTEVRLDTDYFEHRSYFDGLAHKIIFTGCIDQYFNYEFGQLEYRSLRFENKRINSPDFQGNAVINYTEYDIPYTRIIEHKHFEFGQQPSTVITYEYPQNFSKDTEPYYPVNSHANMEILAKYQDRAAHHPHVIFGGRLGAYKYSDMDDSVIDALALAHKELSKE